MKLNRSIVRRLVPAGAVATVLALAYIAPAQTLASIGDLAGYGYANNCGVKGDGMHDHGKACPNRPFPGQGLGVMRILGEITLMFQSNGTHVSHGHANGASIHTVKISAPATSTSTSSNVDISNVHHGHGHHGHGKPAGV